MKDILFLAWSYLIYYRGRTAVIVASLTLVVFLPLTVQVLVHYYEAVLARRAQETPMVIGAPGSSYDLVLNSLYFKGRSLPTLPMETVYDLRDTDLATPIPMHVRHTAGGFPVVGTSPEYFQFRHLEVKRGRFPTMLGEVVLGANAAERLQAAPGDTILTDDRNLYDLTSDYPLSMRVVGILEAAKTADDDAIFTDVKTTWVIGGIGHGHKKSDDMTAPSKFRAVGEDATIMSSAVVEYQRITRENLDTFHFHGSLGELPLTAVIAVPSDNKAATILKGRLNVNEDRQLVEPRQVVASMMDIVLVIQRFLNTIFGVVLVSTLLLLALIIVLSVRIRESEFTTLRKIGCARTRLLAAPACELGLLMAAGLIFAGTLTGIALLYVTQFRPLL